MNKVYTISPYVRRADGSYNVFADNWLQKVANIVCKFTAITDRKTVRLCDALNFFQGVK